MREITSWLERIGLAEYSENFAREAIDLDTLPKLTDEDLRSLGLPLGHRRRVLDAIAALVADHDRTPTEFNAQASTPPPNPLPAPERRQVTFLFCDLINSTLLSRRLDPEDLCEVIGAYQQACTKPIEQYGGFIARYIGDGILAYFGYPLAHENDAERAVRAGLGIVQAMRAFNERKGPDITGPLSVRIGISTGDVVAGYVVGKGAAEESAVAGEAVNLAAKLQQLARPNTVVISTVTKQLAAERFSYSDADEATIAGFDRPVRYWLVAGEKPARDLETSSAMTFVGRQQEVAMLLTQWDKAQLGQGQVALVQGRAGIGKSRLIATVKDRVLRSAALPQILAFTCSPFQINTAFHPIIQHIVRRASFDSTDSYATTVRKLGTLLVDSDIEATDTAIALLADLVGIRLEETAATPAIGSREKRLRTLEILQTWFKSLAMRHYLLIIFEDIQWLDNSTGQLLRQLVAWSAQASALILMTHRSEVTEHRKDDSRYKELPGNWFHLSHFSLYPLDQLSAAEARLLITATAKGKGVPAAVVDGILQRAEGVPLYIEELTRGILDSTLLLDTGGDYVLKKPLASMAIPDSLSGALTARLDQAGPAKKTAQLASVIGREFPERLLAVISDLPREQLLVSLDRLLAAEIITQVNNAREPTFVFRHALIQEAAYRSLLRRTRTEIHLRLAELLEQNKRAYPDVTDELIAEHYGQAGATYQAISARRRAAAGAIARSAQIEAANLLEMAIDSLSDLPRDLAHRHLELELTMELASALGAVRGYAAPKVEDQYRKARDLCLQLANTPQRFNVEFGLMISHLVKGDLEGADQFAASLADFVDLHPSKPLADALLAKGMVKMQQGRFEEASVLLRDGAKLTRPEDDQPHYFTHGQNSGILCRSYLAHALAFMGETQEATGLVESTLALARHRSSDPSHIYTYVNALAFAGRVHLLLRNSAAVNQYSRELVDISRRNQYAYFEAIGGIQQSWALAREGAIDRGAQQMADGLKVLEATGTGLGVRGFYVQLAELHVLLANKEQALESLQFAVGPPRWGTRAWDAEIERVRGTALMIGPDADPDGALSYCRAAIDIASAQGARILEARAAASGARILMHLHRRSEAYNLLSPYLSRCVDTADSVEIEMMLSEIAPAGGRA